MARPRLNMFGSVARDVGYGVHFINICEALFELADVTVTSRGAPEAAACTPRMKQALARAEAAFCYDAPSVTICPAEQMQLFCGAHRVGFPVFEADRLTDAEVWHLSHLDGVLVTSGWAREVVLGGLGDALAPDRVRVVGEGFDPDTFPSRWDAPDDDDPLAGLPRPCCVSVAKWELRKGQLELIRAAARVEGPLTVVGRWHNPFSSGWLEQAVAALRQEGFEHTGGELFRHRDREVHVVLQGFDGDHGAVARLFRAADFGVFPYRAEGWGLPVLECMGSGTPVIATDYSAPTEYLIDDVGCMLRMGQMDAIYDPVFFPAGRPGEWFVPSVVELTAALECMCAEAADGGLEAMGRAAARRAREFTWARSAARLIEALEDWA